MENKETDFGFKKVNREEKSNLVKEVFSSVAKKYDLMNDLMSAGVHRVWKNEMVKEIDFNDKSKNFRVIDLAGGTGDIAFRITKKANSQTVKCAIDVVDINQEMLDVGKERAVDLNLFQNLTFTCCDGENLCFENETFDFFTIAFGIRNFTNIDVALREAYRVLKPNSKFICLEFSKVNDYFLQKIYDAYSFKVIPKIGEVVLKDKDSYQYLVESIRKFPSQDQFKKMIEDAGFVDVSYKNLTFGTAAIHIGYKK
ncbi:MAG: bifunctional demethylmenaquinone methyltransferase/2-methoxy-6-polyprenyl-1,4-benzoquinol methylase UbiE [Pelagibacterales bacterium]|nr:bifunctional demethylmenaquinone methyltransferase/2-methoxy-6-polyprenyl-1,4-benzoquinol methylase UbiE [Pelagibacterales bacterium]